MNYEQCNIQQILDDNSNLQHSLTLHDGVVTICKCTYMSSMMANQVSFVQDNKNKDRVSPSYT